MEQLLSNSTVLLSLAASLLIVAIGLFRLYTKFVKEL